MTFTMRVSLPGYNALTDGTIDHYSVYADSDNILIKEKNRGTINIGGNNRGTIDHNLGYVPYILVYAQVGTKYYSLAGADFYNDELYFSAGTSNLVMTNYTGGTKTFYYYIFYDNGTAIL